MAQSATADRPKHFNIQARESHESSSGNHQCVTDDKRTLPIDYIPLRATHHHDVKREEVDLWLQDHSWRLTKCTKHLNMTSEWNSMISDTFPLLTALLRDWACRTCTHIMYYYGRQNNH
jgi:hypothetical protein